jgi:hypothetical protein
MTFSGLREAGSLVLVAAGGPSEVAERLERTAAAVATALVLPLLPDLAPLEVPDLALEALAGGPSPVGLACLGVDPGMALEDGLPWARALGAWRQPTLLLVEAHQLAAGTAAATTALLRQHGVPLRGLIQWGSPWQAELRRRDGLPWLGALGLADGDAGGVHDLRLALAVQGAATG